MTFFARRIRNSVLLALVAVAILLAYQIFNLSLVVQQYYTGWVLFGLIFFLLLFAVKKRFSNVIVGSNAAWAQWHYYVGWGLLIVFMVHIEWTVPHGYFERVLALTLGFVLTVGVVGLCLNRIYAKRLSVLPFEVIYEQIEERTIQLKLALEAQLLESVSVSKSSTLADYYFAELSDYFLKTADSLEHLVGSTRSYNRRKRALEQQLRYLNRVEADFVVSLLTFLRDKHVLDCHAALQTALKTWGVLHAPIALVLVVQILVHIVLVYAFRGAL